MSVPAISPVIARIQSIESRFGMPSSVRAAPVGTGGDFASTLSAALASSSTATTAGPAVAPVRSNTVNGGAGATLTSPPASTVATVATGTIGTIGTGVSALDPNTPFAGEFEAAGARYGVPAELLSAVGYVESRYQTDAVSSAGAMGMMQIMPAVATELGVDPYAPAQAIDGAARLLKSHFDRFGSWDLALAAYNAGAGAVARAGNTIPSPRVAEYVRRVDDRMMTS